MFYKTSSYLKVHSAKIISDFITQHGGAYAHYSYSICKVVATEMLLGQAFLSSANVCIFVGTNLQLKVFYV